MGCTESQERLLIQSLRKEQEEGKRIEMELRAQINLHEFEISTLQKEIKNQEFEENHKINNLKNELESLVTELNSHKS